MKNFYVQVEETGKIRDIISKPHEGYTEVSIATPLPQNIITGTYQLVGDSVIYRAEWDDNIFKQRLDEQQASIIELENVISEMAFGGEL